MDNKPGTDPDMAIIEADPTIGPTVKALLRLPAFAAERRRVADRLRARAVRPTVV